MISPDEYERVIESFLMELQSTIAATDEDAVVGQAFGIMDEFVHAAWADIMKECYTLYMDMSGGKSHRHLNAEI